MNEFGDFANIDVDKLLSGAQERFARMQDMQERIAGLVGQGQDRDGLVRATYTSSGGLTDFSIDPRAMRKGSQELAETVKEVVRAAAADLQRQVTQVTAEALGQDTLLDRDAALAKAQEAQQAFDRTMKDAVGELDRIRQRLGL